MSGQMAQCVVVVLVAVLLLCFFQPRWLTPVLRIWWLSPNMVTSARVVLYWGGFGLLFRSVVVGVAVMSLAVVLDFLDGMIAKMRDRLNDPQFPGTTLIGKWWDPLADKATLVLSLILFAPQVWQVWAIAAVETLGTFLREPFLSFRSLFWLRRLMRSKAAATGIGKAKFVGEALAVGSAICVTQGWAAIIYVEVFGTLTLILAVGSVLSRFDLGRAWNKNVDRFTSAVRHRVRRRTETP